MKEEEKHPLENTKQLYRLFSGKLVYSSKTMPYAEKIKNALVDIQYNNAEDPFGWRFKVCD